MSTNTEADGRQYNILIDCGKTFYTQAITWCPKYRLRRLDAVILSHGHADAMLGLDDLRAWTLGQYSIQSHVDVYLTADTFAAVQQVFPYLVDTTKASGGGDVAGLQFHIINRDPDNPRLYEPIRIGQRISIRPFDGASLLIYNYHATTIRMHCS
jgi:phosphoribosyl 1,2-cyclic phosphodiesterase